MEILKKKILFGVLILFFSFSSWAAFDKDTLSIRQAFDWKIGDSLMYGPSTGTYGPFIGYPAYPWIWSTTGVTVDYGFSVIGRADNRDTITYALKWFDGHNDTLVFCIRCAQ